MKQLLASSTLVFHPKFYKESKLESITLEDLQANFDEVFERVEDGESFIIIVDGKEMAVLMPFDDYEEMNQKVE